MRTAGHMRAGFFVALGLLPALLPTTARAQVSVEIQMNADRTNVAVGAPFSLQVRADVSGAQPTDIALPDLSAFRITSRRVSRPMQFTFGSGSQRQVVRSTIAYDLTLSALNEGRVQNAPASIQVAGQTYRTDPVVIQVGAGTGTAPGNSGIIGQTSATGSPPDGPLDGATYDETAFLRTTVSTGEPYIGQQVTVTVYLYVRGSIRSSPIIHREPNADGFWVHDLLPASRTLEPQRQMVGGLQFNVYVLRRFAAFPLREGGLEVGAMSVAFETGSVFDIFSTGRSGAVRREGVTIPLRSRPLPTANHPGGDVYVGTYAIDASLDRTSARAGDAITLTARVEGVGNLRDVRLDLPEVEGIRILDPEVTDELGAPNDVVGGSRTFAWLIVPERPGDFRLPALSFSTFSPVTESYSRVTGPELTLAAAGNALVDMAADDDDAARSAQTRAPELGPIRSRSELTRNPPAESLPMWLLVLFAMPPMTWLLSMLLSFGRRRLDARGHRNAPQRAVRTAKKRLVTAEGHVKEGDARAFYAEVQKVIKDVLEARLGEAVGGFTHGELEKYLRSRGMDEDLARRVVDELEGSEFAQYSSEGASADEMFGCRVRVGALLERMDRFAPVSPVSRSQPASSSSEARR